jgi:hypothetical protein
VVPTLCIVRKGWAIHGGRNPHFSQRTREMGHPARIKIQIRGLGLALRGGAEGYQFGGGVAGFCHLDFGG